METQPTSENILIPVPSYSFTKSEFFFFNGFLTPEGIILNPVNPCVGDIGYLQMTISHSTSNLDHFFPPAVALYKNLRLYFISWSPKFPYLWSEKVELNNFYSIS